MSDPILEQNLDGEERIILPFKKIYYSMQNQEYQNQEYHTKTVDYISTKKTE